MERLLPAPRDTPALYNPGGGSYEKRLGRLNTHLGEPTRDFNAGEFLLVIAVTFGLAIAGSLGAALSYSGEPIDFNDDLLMGTVVYEFLTGSIAFTILRTRGWKWSDFAVHASRGSTIVGVIVALAIFGFGYAFEAIFGKVPAVLSATLLPIAIISILNPFFEELLILGYVVQSIRKKFGITIAFNVSLALRILSHLYQGPIGVVQIAVMGIVFTLVYVKMGRLWPVIVAHGLLDLVGLSVDI